MSVFGLDTLSRYPGFGFGWANTDFPFSYSKKGSCGVTRRLSLVSGDVLKMRAKVVVGASAETSANTVRFRIKKR